MPEAGRSVQSNFSATGPYFLPSPLYSGERGWGFGKDGVMQNTKCKMQKAKGRVSAALFPSCTLHFAFCIFYVALPSPKPRPLSPSTGERGEASIPGEGDGEDDG